MSKETSLIQVTGKTVYPLVVAEVKQHLNIADDDTAHDDQLTRLIQAATQTFEHDTGLKATYETWKYIMPDFPSGDEFYIPAWPIQSITHIKYYDDSEVLQTLNSGWYVLDAASGSVNRGNSRVWLLDTYDWPDIGDRLDAVQTTFVAGYSSTSASVPAVFKQCILLLCGFWFEHRGEPISSAVQQYPAYAAMIQRFVRPSYP